MKYPLPTLQNLGWSDKKAKIYLTLLELGEATVVDISKKAELRRTTVYNILPELMSEGYVQRTGKGHRHRFFVNDVHDLLGAVKKQEQEITSLLPQLEAMHNLYTNKPNIAYYEGIGGLRAMYQDTLDSVNNGDTILSYTGLHDYERLIPDDYEEWYVAQRLKRKIRVKIIVPDSPAAKGWQQKSAATLREVRIVPAEQFSFNADLEIYGHKVAMISYKEGFMGVIIESREISDMQRSAFELMWRAAAPQTAPLG